MTIGTVDFKCILAQSKWATETTTVELVDDVGSYTYMVSIDGGRHHGVQILCRSEASAMWLFEQIVTHRKSGIEWEWLRVSHMTQLNAGITHIGVDNGMVTLTVCDDNQNPLLALEYTPDQADTLASTLVVLAAQARRDGAPSE